MLLFAAAVPVLLLAALFVKARQTTLEREAKPAQEAALRKPAVPLVNVMAPQDFIPPISIVITDSQGHCMRVVVDEHGQQHADPVFNLN